MKSKIINTIERNFKVNYNNFIDTQLVNLYAMRTNIAILCKNSDEIEEILESETQELIDKWISLRME